MRYNHNRVRERSSDRPPAPTIEAASRAFSLLVPWSVGSAEGCLRFQQTSHFFGLGRKRELSRNPYSGIIPSSIRSNMQVGSLFFKPANVMTCVGRQSAHSNSADT